MRSIFPSKVTKGLLFFTSACLSLFAVSCVSPTNQKSEEKRQAASLAVVSSESEGFVEKPVKMPRSLKKRGDKTGISIDEVFLAQQSGEALIYDVRDPYFYQKDHIPGAINWPGKNYAAEVQKRDREIQQALASGKKVIVYCFSLMCPEARNVATKLAKRDYSIHVFNAGIDSWRDAGLPLTQPGS